MRKLVFLLMSFACMVSFLVVPAFAGTWQNTTFNFCRNIQTTETGYSDRIFEIANTYVDFTGGTKPDQNSVMLVNSTCSNGGVPIQLQLSNVSVTGSKINTANLIFETNATKNAAVSYSIYYDPSPIGSLSLNATPNYEDIGWGGSHINGFNSTLGLNRNAPTNSYFGFGTLNGVGNNNNSLTEYYYNGGNRLNGVTPGENSFLFGGDTIGSPNGLFANNATSVGAFTGPFLEAINLTNTSFMNSTLVSMFLYNRSIPIIHVQNASVNFGGLTKAMMSIWSDGSQVGGYRDFQSAATGTYIPFSNESSGCFAGMCINIIMQNQSFIDNSVKKTYIGGNTDPNFLILRLDQNYPTAFDYWIFLSNNDTAQIKTVYNVTQHPLIFNISGENSQNPPSAFSTNTSQDPSSFETNTTNFYITVNVSDLTVRNVSAYLSWNNTNQSFDGYSNDTIGNFTFNKTLRIPFMLGANNTAIGTWWNVSVTFNNGTMVNGSTANTSQSVLYAYYFSSLAGSVSQIVYPNTMNITARDRHQVQDGIADNMTVLFDGVQYTNTSYVYNFTQQAVGWSDQWDYNPVFTPNITGNNITIHYNATYTAYNGTQVRIQSQQGDLTVFMYKPSVFQCGTGPTIGIPTLGLFMYNESTGTNSTTDNSVNSTVNGVFNFTVSSNSSLISSMNISMTGNTRYYICLYPTNVTVQVNSHMVYQPVSNANPRDYFLTNATLNNVSTEIDLFHLPSSAPDNKVNFILRDSSSNLLSGYIVSIQKWFVGSNTYPTVAMAQSDNNGNALTYLQLYNTYYRITITRGTQVVATYDAATIKCLDSANCIQNLFVSTPTGIDPFKYVGRLAGTCSYTNSTLTLSCTAVDMSGLANQYCLNVKEFNTLQTINTANVCVGSSTGTVGYTFPSFNASKAYTYQLSALTSGTISNQTILYAGSLQFFGPNVLGNEGVVVAFIVIGTIAFMGLFSPMIGIILLLLATGFMSAMQIINLPIGAFTALVIIGLIIIWRMRSRGE